MSGPNSRAQKHTNTAWSWLTRVSRQTPDEGNHKNARDNTETVGPNRRSLTELPNELLGMIGEVYHRNLDQNSLINYASTSSTMHDAVNHCFYTTLELDDDVKSMKFVKDLTSKDPEGVRKWKNLNRVVFRHWGKTDEPEIMPESIYKIKKALKDLSTNFLKQVTQIQFDSPAIESFRILLNRMTPTNMSTDHLSNLSMFDASAKEVCYRAPSFIGEYDDWAAKNYNQAISVMHSALSNDKTKVKHAIFHNIDMGDDETIFEPVRQHTVYLDWPTMWKQTGMQDCLREQQILVTLENTMSCLMRQHGMNFSGEWIWKNVSLGSEHQDDFSVKFVLVGGWDSVVEKMADTINNLEQHRRRRTEAEQGREFQVDESDMSKIKWFSVKVGENGGVCPVCLKSETNLIRK